MAPSKMNAGDSAAVSAKGLLKMVAATDTSWAPWYVVDANDKRKARLNCITHLLSLVPYEDTGWKKPKLPDRQKPHGYRDPKYNYRYVPAIY